MSTGKATGVDFDVDHYCPISDGLIKVDIGLIRPERIKFEG